MASKPVTIMGIFAVDLSFRVRRLPAWGETVFGSTFQLGPGGKGSNQAIAAARLGCEVHFISKVGADTFGDLARRFHAEAGVKSDFMLTTADLATGAAAIIVDEQNGENAVIVTPGAANALMAEEIDTATEQIARSACFMTQLELSMHLVEHGLRVARKLGVPTILNPAPACECNDSFLELCDYITPNETEAAALTGMPVETIEQIQKAAEALLRRGPRHVAITLGARGAFVMSGKLAQHIPAFQAGPVIETTGAGDAFNGGFAVGIAEGMNFKEAAQFGCAVAGISVTRPGTAPSMPSRVEVEQLMSKV